MLLLKPLLVAVLWQRNPKGCQVAHHNYRNSKLANHATLFSWSTLLAAWIIGVCTRRQKTMLHNTTAILQLIPSLGLLHTSLMLDIHVMINWHLSKQGFHWPVWRDHIASLGLEFIEIMCFFWSWPRRLNQVNRNFFFFHCLCFV